MDLEDPGPAAPATPPPPPEASIPIPLYDAGTRHDIGVLRAAGDALVMAAMAAIDAPPGELIEHVHQLVPHHQRFLLALEIAQERVRQLQRVCLLHAAKDGTPTQPLVVGNPHDPCRAIGLVVDNPLLPGNPVVQPLVSTIRLPIELAVAVAAAAAARPTPAPVATPLLARETLQRACTAAAELRHHIEEACIRGDRRGAVRVAVEHLAECARAAADVLEGEVDGPLQLFMLQTHLADASHWTSDHLRRRPPGADAAVVHDLSIL